MFANRAFLGITKIVPAVKNFEQLNRQQLLLKDRLEKVISVQRDSDSAWIHKHMFELHRKLAGPLACLVFTIFSIPASLIAPRSGRAYGLIVGMVIATIYWSLLVSSQDGGIREFFSPIIAAWIPNLVVLLISGGMYWVWHWRYGFNE